MSWEQGDVSLFDVDLDLFDFDLSTFDGNFPLDARVEVVDEVICENEMKTDELSSLSSDSFEEPSCTPTEQQPQKATCTKKARKFGDIINEDAVLREKDVVSRTVELESKMTKVAHSHIQHPVATDIRNVYPRMFLNSVNSGDMMNVQSYFNTFMTGPCTFIANHQFHSSFGMPEHMTAVGPQFFSHYLLGCFMTFPDMVVKLLDSHVVIDPNWVGTKIVMDTEVNCTKIYDMADADYAWVPEVDNLSEVYQQMSLSGKGTADTTDSSAGDYILTPSSSSGGYDSSYGKDFFKPASAAPSRRVATNNNLALTRIPQTYVEKLYSEATMMRVPEPLVSRGTVTLYLDLQNCMQHVVVDLVQQNKSDH